MLIMPEKYPNQIVNIWILKCINSLYSDFILYIPCCRVLFLTGNKTPFSTQVRVHHLLLNPSRMGTGLTYVRPHSVISLLRPDIELRQLTDMSHLTVLSARWDPIPKTAHKYVRPHSVISLLRPDTEGSSQMSDLTVLSACWDPISKSAHKYVRPHSVISLLRPDIEGSSQICQTSQRYQPVETRYRRQLTNISDFIVLSACWDTISHWYQCT